MAEDIYGGEVGGGDRRTVAMTDSGRRRWHRGPLEWRRERRGGTYQAHGAVGKGTRRLGGKEGDRCALTYCGRPHILVAAFLWHPPGRPTPVRRRV
jgi:hypothetical protein